MWRDELPRIFELRDLLSFPLASTAYFQRFEESLSEFPVKKKHFRHIEAELQQLDPLAWSFLKAKLQPLLSFRHPTRGWQSLFDTLNEAKGYKYLRSIGCTKIQFIPESTKDGRKTPDLEAELGFRKVLCEVKTINVSEDEARARRDQSARETVSVLPDEFFGKLRSDLNRAKEQMDSFCADPTAKKVAYVVINFDDSLHECADSYREQIDSFVLDNIGDLFEVILDIKPPFYSATIE